MKIKGSTFIVTGGASGLGAATVRKLVAKGAHVVIADLNVKDGKALASSLSKSVKFVETDVTNEESTKNTVSFTWEHFGDLDGAINCAGFGVPEKIIDKGGKIHSFENYVKSIQVNLIGTFNVCRLVGSAIAKRKAKQDGEKGILINTASLAAFEGQVGQVSYAAAKGGVVAMTLPMARDMAPFGIRVMAIAPGVFDTPMLEGISENARNAIAHQIPFPARLGKPEEFAQLVESIIENEMLNGTVIRLDGAMRPR